MHYYFTTVTYRIYDINKKIRRSLRTEIDKDLKYCENW